MKITQILTISTFGILLSACNANQMQVEGSTAAVGSGTGPAHVHNVEGTGDVTHQHKGNSTANHSHTWQEIQNEIKRQGL